MPDEVLDDKDEFETPDHGFDDRLAIELWEERIERRREARRLKHEVVWWMFTIMMFTLAGALFIAKFAR